MNLRKQVEPLFDSRPSGFLSAEACTRGGAAIHLGLALAQANLLSQHEHRRAEVIVAEKPVLTFDRFVG